MRKSIIPLFVLVVLVPILAQAWEAVPPYYENFYRKVADGTLGDAAQPVSLTGINADVGTSWELLNNVSAVPTFLSAAEQLKVVSSSTDDDVGGSGSTAVTVQGYNATYDVCQ